MNIVDDLQRAYWDGYDDGKKPEWISVDDKLPEVAKEVLTYRGHENLIQVEVYWGNGDWLNDAWESREVTHWMPLPKPPNYNDKVDGVKTITVPKFTYTEKGE